MSVSPPRTDAEVDLSGRKLGDYQILRRLGRGGMADVYLAEQASLQRQVAFKVLKPGLASDEAYVRRFRNEALAAAKLSHANIVQIYEVNCVSGIHFIAQEYVKGQNLKQLLTRHRSVDARLATSVMRQVAAALHRAGQKGVIHRDIKPENIMLSSNGEVKVADFGLARVLQDSDAMNLTQVGVTMGTPLYMSPEQVEGKGVDQRSDLYSFGVTCYHMFAGRPPFEGEEALSIAVQHLKSEPESLEELRPDLPPGLCRIVHKLMAKEPDQRFQTAAELLRELRTLQPSSDDDEAWAAEALAWIDHELSTSSGADNAATRQLQSLMQTAALQRRSRQRRWAWGLAAILLGLFAGGAAAWSTRPRPLLEEVALEVPRQSSARLQFGAAVVSKDPSPEQFEAVWKYFPPGEGDKPNENTYYARMAKHYLANWYLEHGNFDKAASLYTELTQATDDVTGKFPLKGHLGLANVAHSRKDEKAKEAELNKAAILLVEAPEEVLSQQERNDLMGTLKDNQMRERLEELYELYLQILQDEAASMGYDGSG